MMSKSMALRDVSRCNSKTPWRHLRLQLASRNRELWIQAALLVERKILTYETLYGFALAPSLQHAPPAGIGCVMFLIDWIRVDCLEFLRDHLSCKTKEVASHHYDGGYTEIEEFTHPSLIHRDQHGRSLQAHFKVRGQTL
jgi:hypothetical protein